MSDEITHPTEYNEFVELIEANDTAVIATILSESYTPNEELRALIQAFEARIGDNERKAKLHGASASCLDDFYRGIAIGRKRSAMELEELIDDD